jgi:hypothetical protein
MVAAMVQDLAGDSDQDIADGYRRAARGINERYRTHGPPHDRERYLEEHELAPLLEQRGDAVVEFVRGLDTANFLLRHGLTPAGLGRGAVPLRSRGIPMTAGSLRRLLAAGAAGGLLAASGFTLGPAWAADQPVVPGPSAVGSDSSGSGLPAAGLEEAVLRDLGLTPAEFAAAGELGRQAAEVAAKLRDLPGYLGIRLQTARLLCRLGRRTAGGGSSAFPRHPHSGS